MTELRPQEPRLEELAARIRSGDAAAEEIVVTLFQRPVRAYAMMQTGDSHIADELVQDVLWAVITALREGRVQQPGQLGAFVRGTARNLVSDRVREKARAKLDPLPDEIANPAREQESFERDYAARQAIAKLESHERVVLMLCLVEGLGPEEMAQRLGVTAEVVRQRKSRALRRLGDLLRPPVTIGRRRPTSDMSGE